MDHQEQGVQAGAAGGQGAVQGNGAQAFGQGVPGQNIIEPGVIMEQAQLKAQPKFAAQGIAGLLSAFFRPWHREEAARNGGRHRGPYTAAQKQLGLDLLNLGLTSRQVACAISPHCTSKAPRRWRREAARREEQRQRLEKERRRYRKLSPNGWKMDAIMYFTIIAILVLVLFYMLIYNL